MGLGCVGGVGGGVGLGCGAWWDSTIPMRMASNMVARTLWCVGILPEMYLCLDAGVCMPCVVLL